MDKMKNHTICVEGVQESPQFIKKIDKTTYNVTIHFNDTSKETIDDKVRRLIQNEYINMSS